MTKIEFEQELEKLGFSKQRFSEYHNNVYVNENYDYKNRKMSLDIYVDFYNVRIVWRYQKGKKVAKCYSVFKEIADSKETSVLLADFFESMIELYKI